MKFSVKIEGLRELDEALRELPKATGKNVLRRVARDALEPMAEEARRLAPDDPKTGPPHDLKSSIKVGSRAKAGGGRLVEKASSVVAYMGPTRDGYPQAMPVEFGSAPHYVNKGAGKAAGKVKATSKSRGMHPGNAPHPYMRPAFDGGWRPMLGRVGAQLATEIEKARQRLARKAERLAAKTRS